MSKTAASTKSPAVKVGPFIGDKEIAEAQLFVDGVIVGWVERISLDKQRSAASRARVWRTDRYEARFDLTAAKNLSETEIVARVTKTTTAREALQELLAKVTEAIAATR